MLHTPSAGRNIEHLLFIYFFWFKDVEGKTALHHAIENAHHKIIGFLLDQSGLDLTLRDKSGLSPFAAAMTFRNNVAARRILQVHFYNCFF